MNLAETWISYIWKTELLFMGPYGHGPQVFEPSDPPLLGPASQKHEPTAIKAQLK